MLTIGADATEQEAAQAAERWLRENLPAAWVAAVDAGDRARVETFLTDEAVMADWFARLGDAGLATPTWPRRYGGLDLSADAAAGIAERLLRYRAGRPMTDFIGLTLAGPTILKYGTEAQRERFLRPIGRGEHRWCQLFSEPGAGSDLAGLSTRAEQQPDGTWLVNGQKVWSSFAHLADFGILLARTDPTRPKHKGLSYFLVDMRAPGVEPRPLKQMTGGAEFNEVFLSGVVLPADALLGEVNNGWAVAISTLMHERNGLTGRPGVGEGKAHELVRRAMAVGTWDDPLLRDRLMRFFVVERVLQMTTVRAYVESGRNEVGAEGSIRKLVSASLEEAAGVLAADVDPVGVLAWSPGEALPPSPLDFLTMKQTSIAGGTSEIQRNIIGERVLGLPRDPDPDKDIPFNERRRE